VNDGELDAHLKKAGLSVKDPAAREKLRESLFVGLQYTALPITDPRFINHAEHMDMNVGALRQQLVEIGNTMLETQEKGEKAIKRFQQLGESKRKASVAGVGAGFLTGAGAFIGSYLWFERKVSGLGKRIFSASGVAALTAVVIGTITSKYLGAGMEKQQDEIIEKGRALDEKRLEIDQAAQALDAKTKEEFMRVHLQRAFTKWEKEHGTQHAPESHAVAPIEAPVVAQEKRAEAALAAGHDEPARLQPHVPVANAETPQTSVPAAVHDLQPHGGSFAEREQVRPVSFTQGVEQSKAVASSERGL
jgi:hypothetical protein